MLTYIQVILSLVFTDLLQDGQIFFFYPVIF